MRNINKAKCLGSNPVWFDLDVVPKALDNDLLAQHLCRGCKVIPECAADAVEPLAIGTIRAGVAIPSNGKWNRPGRNRAVATLRLLATGKIELKEINEHLDKGVLG